MRTDLPFLAFVRDVAQELAPYGIEVELITRSQERPGLLRCRRPDSGRSIFLLADHTDCSHLRAMAMADYVKQEMPLA